MKTKKIEEKKKFDLRMYCPECGELGYHFYWLYLPGILVTGIIIGALIW